MEITIIFTLIILLFSIIIHEVAHGSVSYSLGDNTAKDAGRLTLNPISHLDPVGSIMLPLFLFILNLPIIGWAKPVPINPYNFNDQKWGEVKVSIAGSLANFIIALVFGLIVMFVSLPQSFLEIASLVIIYNIALGIFNLMPIPPLDGSHILFALLGERFNNVKKFLYQYGFFILIFLVFFNGINWLFSFSYWITSLFFKFSLV
ncbi:MAG: site-2 protease family protein [Candidatus Pacebacteria bacterium]|nr:site-2 protease family protein [Candidatus Paceibacterota bacterium]MDD4074085.1 site-2 protease family protein [Candidatus Paceibacterota bacterium]